MAKPFDAVLKVLVETEPEGWLPLVGRPKAPASVLDADVSAVVTGAADKVLQVNAPSEYLLHLDFQSGHDSATLPGRLRLYNVVLEDRHQLPVWSVAFILRPEADSPRLTGLLETGLPGESPFLTFRYGVTRVCQLPAKQLLEGGLGALPLAAVSDVSLASLPSVVRRMKARLRGKAQARELWAATYILLGLRHSAEMADVMLRGVISMEESTTYQAILARGRQEGELEGALNEARRMLLRLGRKLLGPADEATVAAIHAITDVHRLEQLAERVNDAGSWAELLAALLPHPRNGRRDRRRRRKP